MSEYFFVDYSFVSDVRKVGMEIWPYDDKCFVVRAL